MIDQHVNPEQARLWASLLGERASAGPRPIMPGTQPPVQSSPLLRQQTWFDHLLQRIQAQRETRKNMQAQEFVAGM